MKRYAGLLALFGAVLLVGCNSTTSTPTITPTNYQGTAPENRLIERGRVAEVRTQLAAQYISERKLDEAKRQLETALQSNNRYAPAYEMMGVLLQTEGSPSNLAKADEYFRRSLSLDGNSMKARNNYGVYLAQIGKHREAIAQFEVAGAALGYEGRATALENLGMSYVKIGQSAKAKEAFIRAMDADRNSAIARIELINILLAEGNSLLAKQLYDELTVMAGSRQLPAEIMLQGIKISILQGNQILQQQLSQRLLSVHPLSDEAKRLKTWLANPQKPLQ